MSLAIIDLLGNRQAMFLVTAELLKGIQAVGCGRISGSRCGPGLEADQKEGGALQGRWVPSQLGSVNVLDGVGIWAGGSLTCIPGY